MQFGIKGTSHIKEYGANWTKLRLCLNPHGGHLRNPRPGPRDQTQRTRPKGVHTKIPPLPRRNWRTDAEECNNLPVVPKVRRTEPCIRPTPTPATWQVKFVSLCTLTQPCRTPPPPPDNSEASTGTTRVCAHRRAMSANVAATNPTCCCWLPRNNQLSICNGASMSTVARSALDLHELRDEELHGCLTVHGQCACVGT